ncbi:MAG: PHA/PHB synthase family protein [Burkholderiaceae bacterium]
MATKKKTVKAGSESAQNQAITFADLAESAMKIMTDAVDSSSASVSTPSLPTLDPQSLANLQMEYTQRLAEMFSGSTQVAPKDRRFSANEWQQGPFAWTASLYELNAEFMGRMASGFQGDPKQVERAQFSISQLVDAMSPANFLATNPQAQQEFLSSDGASLQAGFQNLMEDIVKGSISQTDENAFEVGENLAVTPGSVVYENELIQLIQYAPTTAKVGAVPMVMIPPCINKFYILDLQPENSVIAWLLDQGHTVFLVSWRNPQADQGKLTWDDYLSTGVIRAIEVTREIAQVDQVNAFGFCVGGTLITTALAALAARGEKPVQSLTLLTTLLDFEEPGILNVMIDEAHVQLREATLGEGGLLKGSELAQTFSSLRPNDLIWNYVARNYLQGKKPPAFDLLYWNADSTNLPGPAFAWYLRHLYLQNELREPGKLICAGEPIDLSRLDMPVFIYGSREDHIVPWQAAYASRRLLGGETEFVLGASGHIAGVINAPAKNKRNYWVSPSKSASADDWFDEAIEIPGSWWPHWANWLEPRKGGDIPAPKAPGGHGYAVIEPAPGRYVRAKA